MQPDAVPLDPVDGILEHYGYYVSAGVRRHTQSYWHVHRDIEIVFVHSGTADVYLNGQDHTLQAGDLILTRVSSRGDFNRTVVHFVLDLLPIEAHNKVSRLLDDSDYLKTSLSTTSASRFSWATHELHCLNKKSGAYTLVQALMGLVAVEIEISASQPNSTHLPYQLQQVINYMKVNIASDEKLACLADRFKISTRHLYNLFASQYGCSPRQYWLSLKLDHARSLLQSDQSINEIASAVGFQTIRGFQRAFQRAYHISPSQYKINREHYLHRLR